jgi:hypothetical protein
MIFQALVALLFGIFQLPATSAAPAQTSFRVAGIVVDGIGGQPLARAAVILTGVGVQDPGATVFTSDDGRFVFEQVSPGKYYLSARRKGYIQQSYKQHGVFSTAIVVAEGLDTASLRFAIYPRASISGQVFDERNDPVRGAPVIFFYRGSEGGTLATRFAAQVITDDEGHYHIGNLAPGTYFVGTTAQPWYAQHFVGMRAARFDSNSDAVVSEALPPPDPALDVVYLTTFFSNATELAAASPITLRPGDAQIADLALHPVPAVRILVKTPVSEETSVSVQANLPTLEGAPQPLSTTAWQPRSGITEIAGLPPGQVTLSLTFVKGNEATTHLQTVHLAADTEIDASDAPLSPTVRGVVTLDNNSPLSQPAVLQLRNAATGEDHELATEPNGEFDFNNTPITPGTYEVAILQPSGTTVRKLSASGGKASGHSVAIGSGQEVRLTVVISKGSGQITGFALKDGQPMEGVMIVLVPQDSQRSPDFFRRDQSDSDGSFNLYEVFAGKYTLIAIENGWDLEWSSPEVLQRYLAGGEKIQVVANAQLEVKVNVQQ